MVSGEELNRRVNKLIRTGCRNFTIGNCPEEVFQEFDLFSKLNTRHNWSMAIKELLREYGLSKKEETIFSMIQELKERVSVLEATPQPDQKKKLKMFGGTKKNE